MSTKLCPDILQSLTFTHAEDCLEKFQEKFQTMCGATFVDICVPLQKSPDFSEYLKADNNYWVCIHLY